jgi:plasmid replication initiation protein
VCELAKQKIAETNASKDSEAFRRGLVAKHTDVSEQEPMSRSVNMSNALVSSAQGLSLVEKRIMCLAVAGLDSRRHYGREAPVVTVSASDYAELADIKPEAAYQELMEGVKRLYERSIHFEESWKHPTRKKPSVAKVSMRWVGRAKYIEGQGHVELAFWWEIMPHLTLLKERFTSYKLSQAAAIRSLYSWRILELLTQFESTGWREFTVEDLAKTLELPDSYLKDFSRIKQRVIEPAVKELESKDGWIIKVAYKKAGRKISRVRFDFQRNPQGDLFRP